MSETYVLRLSAGDLAAGRVVGRIESIRTGAAAVVQTVDELIAFLQASAAGLARAADEAPGS